MKKDEAKPLTGEIESARKAAIDQARATKAMWCLYNLMIAAKSQSDPVTWIQQGGQELEDLYDALKSGAAHPVIEHWRRKRMKSRQPPDARELWLRRMVHIFVSTLERAQLPKGAARELAAKRLAAALPAAPTAFAIRHWQRDEKPLTADENHFIDKVIKGRGHDHELLATFFIGLILARRDPFVRFLPEH